MGQAAAAAPLVLQGFSQIYTGLGERAGKRYEAQRAERAADIARLQADQTDTALRGELDQVLGSIQAIRASTGADPFSPTSLAVMRREQETSARERRIRRSSAELQATQSEADARFYRSAGNQALFGRVIKSLPFFLGAR